MIDWWGVIYNLLWILGLAGGLAALGMANYQARARQVRLRLVLNGAEFQLPFSASMALFCLGLLFSGRAWWERALWGLLAVLLAGQAIWLWRQQRPTPPPAEAEVAPRREQPIRWLGRGLILAGSLVLSGWLVVTGVQVLDHARSLQAHLGQLEALAQGNAAGLDLSDLGGAGEHLAGMRADLETIDARVGPFLPLGRLLSWLPTYGGDLAAAADLLDLAVAVSAAGDRTFQALAPALDLLAGPEETADSEASSSPTSIGERLLPVLIAARPELQAARQELATAAQSRENLDAGRLSPRVAGLLERLDRYLPWFETALDGALLAPDLLGADEPRTYLLLAQNNYELRAGGGFITGVGELGIEGGRLASLSFSDSYAVDNLAVPHEITPLDFQATLFGQLWFFRDTNWDADFATSARRARDVYANDRGVRADGVIALDLTALQLLVDAVGPLQVEGTAEPVTGKNVLSIIQQQWDESYAEQEGGIREWWLHRKDFMGQIARAVMDKLLSGQGVQPLKLAQALKSALDEKHLLIYLDDPQAAGLLRQRNWDGALTAPSQPSDLLLVIDSNVGFDKMDASVSRSIRYRVDLGADGGPRAALVLTYHNRSSKPAEACVQESRYGDTYADMMQRCYWAYVRAYAPEGSDLLAGPELPLPPGSLLARQGDPSELALPPVLSREGRAIWTAFFTLEPLGELTLTFDYRLPASVLSHDADGLAYYRLWLQKQPGTEATPLELAVVLPPGAELVRTSPAAGWAANELTLTLAADLRTDRELEIVYREGGGQP